MLTDAQEKHASFADCNAALPSILGAPVDFAPIHQLCFRPDSGARSFIDEVKVTVENGIEGDRWRQHSWLKKPDGSPDPRIQVSILSKQVMDLCWRDRQRMPHPGDLLVVDMNLGEDNLPAGTKLKAGSAILEVSDKFNTACRKWHMRYGGESLKWINRPEHRKYRLRGVLCSVVQDGVIKVGDVLCKDQSSSF